MTLALNPHAAGEPGWQLSFAAVAGLLALAPRSARGAHRAAGAAPLAEAAAVTVAATLATAPLLALHFEQVSLVSLPANLVARRAVAPVMWLGMLAIAVAQLAPAFAAPLNLVCAPLLGFLEWTAHTAAGVPLAAVDVRLGGPAGLAAGYGALAARLRARPRRSSCATLPAGTPGRAKADRRGWIPPGAGPDAERSAGSPWHCDGARARDCISRSSCSRRVPRSWASPPCGSAPGRGSWRGARR